MSPPVLTIELAGPVPPGTMQRLRDHLACLAWYFEESRVGAYDLCVRADRLGATDAGGEEEPPCPFTVSIMGPGIGDEALFDAEHDDEVDRESLIGFTPTHAVTVMASASRPVSHLVTALLTATVMDIVGGVVCAELADGQRSVVAGLRGLVALASSPWPEVYGSAEFLRAWVRRPGFRLAT
ncbi:DUF6368 family protein [Streptomyces sp. NPDC059783]|uniref:DUF6368 family protein n=1 Tax=Streptomyces sp. NPDC059783 TaxID=3346944 RepID=UPI00364D43F4